MFKFDEHVAAIHALTARDRTLEQDQELDLHRSLVADLVHDALANDEKLRALRQTWDVRTTSRWSRDGIVVEVVSDANESDWDDVSDATAEAVKRLGLVFDDSGPVDRSVDAAGDVPAGEWQRWRLSEPESRARAGQWLRYLIDKPDWRVTVFPEADGRYALVDAGADRWFVDLDTITARVRATVDERVTRRYDRLVDMTRPLADEDVPAEVAAAARKLYARLLDAAEGDTPRVVTL